MAHGITVMQVFKSLGIAPSKELAWSVGSRVANMYSFIYGVQPPKDNRPKTSGSGTHCFAIYPVEWLDKIKAIILAEHKAETSQGDLFAGADTSQQ